MMIFDPFFIWSNNSSFGEKKKFARGMVCQIVEGSQIQNFSLKCCLFNFRPASENFDCYPKMGKQFFLYIFKGCARNKVCSLVFFKVKNEEKIKKYLNYNLDQKPLCPFLEKKKKLEILILFLAIVL